MFLHCRQTAGYFLFELVTIDSNVPVWSRGTDDSGWIDCVVGTEPNRRRSAPVLIGDLLTSRLTVTGRPEQMLTGPCRLPRAVSAIIATSPTSR
jgi:hypothetical protein